MLLSDLSCEPSFNSLASIVVKVWHPIRKPVSKLLLVAISNRRHIAQFQAYGNAKAQKSLICTDTHHLARSQSDPLQKPRDQGHLSAQSIFIHVDPLQKPRDQGHLSARSIFIHVDPLQKPRDQGHLSALLGLSSFMLTHCRNLETRAIFLLCSVYLHSC